MFGADPKSRTLARAVSATSSDVSPRWRAIALLAAFVPLSFVLVQCGKAPPAGTLAANAHATGDTFEDRFPAPQFKDRFPTESETFQQRQPAAAPRSRTAEAEPAPYRVASLAPTAPNERPARHAQTTPAPLQPSALPHLGNNTR